MSYILQSINLHKQYQTWLLKKKSKKILKGINLNIEKWTILGLLWPNWVWKTTFINCVLWFEKIDSGQVTFFGWKKLSQKVLDKIWYLPDQTQYFERMNANEMIKFTEKLQWQKFSEKKINMLFKKLWLENARKQLVATYSAWMKKRLWIILSLLHNPNFLIRDEPMSWLDPIWRIIVKDIIKDLKSKWKTILFSTHILQDAQEICDKVAILFDWKIILEQSIQDLNQNLENFFRQKIYMSTKNK